MSKKVVFWGYRYNNMRESWRIQTLWLAEAFRKQGYEIITKDFKCQGLQAREYDYRKDNPCDVVIYNHADLSEIRGNVVKASCTLFMKPTVPTPYHTTLDPLGYSGYSSIAYKEPDYKDMPEDDVLKFFQTQVPELINRKMTKWGEKKFTEKPDIPQKDYYLIIGQCKGDSTVTQHDFGDYVSKLSSIIHHLSAIRPGEEIVLKLHPYTDGENPKNNYWSGHLMMFNSLSNVTVYKGHSSVHDFLPGCKAVLLANSGAGIEVMMHRKPIISWGFPEYHWQTYDLRHLADLDRALDTGSWFVPGNSDKFLYWYFHHYCFYDQASADRKVAELLKSKFCVNKKDAYL